MSNLKLGVEVISAHNLLPKDGQGSSSASVELQFDGQKFRTTVKDKDLDPVWNETFYFNISNPDELANYTLEAHVYNNSTKSHSKASLGKVRITGTSFVPYSDTVILHYPLEKGSIFSRSRGKLGLRVFIADDPSVGSSNPIPAMDSSSYVYSNSAQTQPLDQQAPDFVPDSLSKRKMVSRRTFHHLPNPNHQLQQPNSYISSSSHWPINYGVDAMKNEPNDSYISSFSYWPINYGVDAMKNEPNDSYISSFSHWPINYGVDAMKNEPNDPKMVRMYSNLSSQTAEYKPKEISPILGCGRVVGGRVIRADEPSSTYHLVEQMQFLFVRVVKAQDLPTKDLTGSLDPYVEVRIGNYKGVTKHFEKTKNPEWNTVFAFSEDRILSSVMQVVVKDKGMVKDDFVGIVRFDLHEIPTRVPPDSPLAPEWYRLEAKNGEKIKEGELMVAVWMGTQADEAYPDAWHSDSSSPFDSLVPMSHVRSKVYYSPRLWYVRVNVIEAQDLVVAEKTRFLDVYVKVHIGNQVHKTKPVRTRTANAIWNEDLMFVAAEPFEDHLIVTVEDRVGEVLGRLFIPLNAVEKCADERIVYSRWFDLQKPSATDIEETKKDKFAIRLHLRISLDGGYHVLDESTQYSSDLRPTAKQLWKPSIGILELGILSADGLHPMKTRDGRGTSDTYCVAKYADKWIRTRTIVDSLNPKFNEQYTWEVFDPSTVLTVAVFDDSHGSKDVRIGKVRLRISTLKSDHVYAYSYPLLVLHPSGVRKMGEFHLVIRFSCTSISNMIFQYGKPLLPKMHYVRPLSMIQLDVLHHQAVNIVAARLSRAEPPLKKEVVEYMTDVDSHFWSLRRTKANFFRLTFVVGRLFAVLRWFEEVCMWKNPVTTALVHVLFLMLVCFPGLILPAVFLYMFAIGMWNYRYRPRYPPHMDTGISHAETVSPDELDEEFDTFPSGKSSDLFRMRYDRLRIVLGRVQTVVGDVATQGELIQALLSWRDPRATTIFVIFCLVAAIVFYCTPFQVLAAMAGFYAMRHPRFRHKLPAAPLNFLRRLPAKTDSDSIP